VRPSFPVARVLATLRARAPEWGKAYVADLARGRPRGLPFKILVSCVLSLRTKDETTEPASKRLFRRARSPRGLLRLDEEELAELIYPVGFYRTKARSLRQLARALLDEHEGEVPRTLDELLALPGVGLKTANLVLGQAFGVPAICVDVHVHRIPNRWGLIRTRTPDESEVALRERVPRRDWVALNPTLVAFGRAICLPVSPRCGECPVSAHCARVGVTHSR